MSDQEKPTPEIVSLCSFGGYLAQKCLKRLKTSKPVSDCQLPRGVFDRFLAMEVEIARISMRDYLQPGSSCRQTMGTVDFDLTAFKE